MRRLREAIGILLSYVPDDKYMSMDAHHDEIYLAGPPPIDMDEDHLDKLEDLGLFWNEEFDCWLRFT